MLLAPSALRATLGAVTKPSLTLRIAAPSTLASPRFYATVSTADGEVQKKPRKASVRSSTPKAPKEPAQPKLKAWDLLDADGNKVPLPKDTRPTYMGAFLHFVTQRIKEVKSDPSLKKTSKTGEEVLDVRKMMARVGQDWKSLSDADRAPFVERGAKAREQYEIDLKNWRESLTPLDIKRHDLWKREQRKSGHSRKVMVVRDPSKPVKGMSAFLHYMQDQRQKGLITGNVRQASKDSSAKWKTLSADEKRPYEEAANADYARYKREHEQYEAKQKL